MAERMLDAIDEEFAPSEKPRIPKMDVSIRQLCAVPAFAAPGLPAIRVISYAYRGWSIMPPVVPPFLIGLIAAPLAKRLFKPLMRGIVKTSVGLALEVKKVTAEAGENIHDLAAEVAAEMVAAQIAAGDGEAGSGGGREAAASGTPKDARDGVAARSDGETRAPKIRPTAGAGKTQ
ncbi:DUF5132 domain-containing protein [Streptomyces sp. SID4985]|uniref:DUF5132 domain-containing protein n=1 Tax=unclassified Streptomyces TaxID=2593676 RepID=UPI001F15EAEB|nr:DUF5132 domain-containing protein [Streptomyces sp. SID4985]